MEIWKVILTLIIPLALIFLFKSQIFETDSVSQAQKSFDYAKPIFLGLLGCSIISILLLLRRGKLLQILYPLLRVLPARTIRNYFPSLLSENQRMYLQDTQNNYKKNEELQSNSTQTLKNSAETETENTLKKSIKQESKQRPTDQDSAFEQRANIILPMRGLRNLGNTCYLNSALQCLHKTYQIMELSKRSRFGDKGKYKEALLHLFTEMSQENSQPFSPSHLKSLISEYNPLFFGNRQHDSGQVFGTILRMLHQDMNEVHERTRHDIDDELRKDEAKSHILWRQSKKRDHKRQKSILDDIIYGRYKTVYVCQVCKQKYILFEKYHMAILPIPYTNEKPTLSQCFEAFSAPQVMEGANAMYCEGCGKDQVTVKHMSIYETNQILVVCLKRFTETEKRNDQVEVPMVIDRKAMVAKEGEDCVYELYGMMIHEGWLDAGHYTAACYDATNGWVLYNDSRVSKISQKKAESLAKTAYVLLYRRRPVIKVY